MERDCFSSPETVFRRLVEGHGNRILAAVACSCRSSGAEIHDPHAPTLPFPRTFPASSLRSEAAEPPSLDEAFNMQSP